MGPARLGTALQTRSRHPVRIRPARVGRKTTRWTHGNCSTLDMLGVLCVPEMRTVGLQCVISSQTHRRESKMEYQRRFLKVTEELCVLPAPSLVWPCLLKSPGWSDQQASRARAVCEQTLIFSSVLIFFPGVRMPAARVVTRARRRMRERDPANMVGGGKGALTPGTRAWLWEIKPNLAARLRNLGRPASHRSLRVRRFLAFWPPQHPRAMLTFRPLAKTSRPYVMHVSGSNAPAAGPSRRPRPSQAIESTSVDPLMCGSPGISLFL